MCIYTYIYYVHSCLLNNYYMYIRGATTRHRDPSRAETYSKFDSNNTNDDNNSNDNSCNNNDNSNSNNNNKNDHIHSNVI